MGELFVDEKEIAAMKQVIKGLKIIRNELRKANSRV